MVTVASAVWETTASSRMTIREPFDSSDAGQLRRLEALDELLPMLSGVLDVRDVFVRISAVAQKVLPHELVGVTLFDEDGEHATVHAIAGEVGPLAPVRRVEMPPSAPLRDLDWDHVIVDDLLADPGQRDLPPAKAGFRSVLRLPLRDGGRTLGMLAFGSRTPAFYRLSDVIVGKRLAAHVLLALSHARLSEERERTAKLRERSANIEMLDGLLAALTGVLSLRQAFDRVSEIAAKVIAHDAMTIVRPTDDPGYATVYAVRGFGDQPQTLNTRMRGPMYLRTDPWDHQIIDDLAADPEYADSLSVKIGLRAALLLAIRVDGRLDAIVTFQSKTKPAAFTKDDVLVARRIVDHMALALSHERLAEEQRRNEELRAKSATLELLDEVLAAVTGLGELPEVWERISAVTQKVLPHDALVLSPQRCRTVARPASTRAALPVQSRSPKSSKCPQRWPPIAIGNTTSSTICRRSRIRNISKRRGADTDRRCACRYASMASPWRRLPSSRTHPRSTAWPMWRRRGTSAIACCRALPASAVRPCASRSMKRRSARRDSSRASRS